MEATQIDEHKKPVLLFVDDTSLTAGIDSNYYSSVGYEVLTESDSDRVLELIREGRVDCLIVDASFANNLGVSLVSEVKKQEGEKKVKVLLTAISLDKKQKQQIKSLGIDSIVMKPAPRPQLLREIKKLTAQQARDTERIHQELEGNGKFGDSIVPLTTLDVSADGIHIKLEKETKEKIASTGVTCKLEVFLNGPEKKPTNLEGEVVRHTKEGVGIRFTNLKRQAQMALDKYMLKHSMEDKATAYYL